MKLRIATFSGNIINLSGKFAIAYSPQPNKNIAPVFDAVAIMCVMSKTVTTRSMLDFDFRHNPGIAPHPIADNANKKI